jgi:hypothetical protein
LLQKSPSSCRKRDRQSRTRVAAVWWAERRSPADCGERGEVARIAVPQNSPAAVHFGHQYRLYCSMSAPRSGKLSITMSVTTKPIMQNCTVAIRLGSLSPVAGKDHSGVALLARNSVGIGGHPRWLMSDALKKKAPLHGGAQRGAAVPR